MPTRNYTLNNGDNFTLAYNTDGNGNVELAFKVANPDGTDKYALTDLRTTLAGESEIFSGATVLANGNLRIFVSVTENFVGETRYIDYNLNTGAQIGGEVAAPLNIYNATGDVFFAVTTTNLDSAQDFLALSNGNLAFTGNGLTFVYQPDGTVIGYGQSDYSQSSTLVEIDGKVLSIGHGLNFVSGAPAQEGYVYGDLFEVDPSNNEMIKSDEFDISENHHILQSLFGLGFNSIDSTTLTDGRIAIAYSDFPYDKPNEIYLDRQTVFVKVINPDGTTDIAEFIASTNNSDGDTIRPEIFALYDGGFAVAFNTTFGFPSVNRTEIRVFDDAGVERDSFNFTGSAPNPENLYVAPDGEVFYYLDNGVSTSEHQFTVDGGPPPTGLNESGNASANTMIGTDYADLLNGKGGADIINGKGGADELIGGNGADTISGGDGADDIYGNKGGDTLNGGNGADEIYGGNGADTLNGGIGGDVLNGGKGVDTLIGGKGADLLAGGDGKDILKGGKGGDFLLGDNGDDTLYGGDGADVFAFSGSTGTDIIKDFEDETDILAIVGGIAAFTDLTIKQIGDDVRIKYDDATVFIEDTLKSQITEDDFLFGLS